MASEFEPTVRTEKTPEACIVIADLPGFRKEDLRVQVDSQGNIIISGERRGKEIQETMKVGGRLEKMHIGGNRFRKVINVPRNLNFEAITAKYSNERLRITTPLLPISDQRIQDAAPAPSGKPDQSADSKAEKSNPAGQDQESSMKEPSRVAQGVQEARHPDDDKAAKGVAAAKESKALVEERKTEAPKQAQDFVHGAQPPLSKDAVRERPDDQSARHPEVMQPADHKAKPIATAVESKELVEKEKAEAPKQAKDSVGVPPLSKDPMQQERSAVAQGDQSARYPTTIRPAEDKSKPNAAAEESKELLGGKKTETPRHGQDIVQGEPATISTDTEALSAQAGSSRDQFQLIQSKSKQDEEKLQQEEKADDDEESEGADDEEEDEEESDNEDEAETETESDGYITPQTQTQIRSSTDVLSMIYKDKVLIASTVLVLSVGLLSYIFRSQSSD